MKRIIDGRMYNTETATLVGHYNNGCSYSDFHVIDESLYIKKTGEWFLYGFGGAMTEYAVKCEDGMTGGSARIISFTDDEAKKWLEKYNLVDEYIKYFGEPEE